MIMTQCWNKSQRREVTCVQVSPIEIEEKGKIERGEEDQGQGGENGEAGKVSGVATPLLILNLKILSL